MWNWNLYDSSSFLMKELNSFHDNTMFILVFIFSLIFYYILFILSNKLVNHLMVSNEKLELIWTFLPGLVLLFIALPSLKILYMLEEVLNPSLTIKAIGHQWYWSYEYPELENYSFDSYMINEVMKESFRLLDVDTRVVIPSNTNVRVITSSSDVIHSWTVPSMGVKIDANPGRLNQCMINSFQTGLFYGQCSEICGALHAFMPICLEVLSPNYFIEWISQK
uniref:cytochrome c oxidase subunit II n=1 Tax=Laemobothrion tinnunculi TaxID=1941263 RepID=UPI0021D538E8|nr:cytochrome c oxidase subunit II [Laemobothrion tinnunculi]UXC94710.1 cytochrome c oxidase subunit II [Laemobothrion tinnunculi]UXC94721.1 cytochrome c oxidase subunit II [Laemobothrion tinnunculi]